MSMKREAKKTTGLHAVAALHEVLPSTGVSAIGSLGCTSNTPFSPEDPESPLTQAGSPGSSDHCPGPLVNLGVRRRFTDVLGGRSEL